MKIISVLIAAFFLAGCQFAATNLDYKGGLTGTAVKADTIKVDTRKKK